MDTLLLAIQHADLNIYRYLGGFAGNWMRDGIIDFAEGNNLFKGGVFFILYWYFWFCEGFDRERTRRVIIAIVIGTLAALIVARTIANIAPFRMRPAFDSAIEHPAYAVHRPADLENWSAFPSDTATYYFALAFGFKYLLPRLAMPMLVYTAGWICMPRMYFGYHYASDMIVGGAVGISAVWISLRAERVHLLARRLLGFEETMPQWFYAIAFLISLEMANTFIELRATARAGLHAVRHRALIPHASLMPLLVAVALASAVLFVAARYRSHRRKLPQSD